MNFTLVQPEALVFLLVDLLLLAVLGVLAMRLTPDPASAPDSLNRPGALVGLLGLVRGLWRFSHVPANLGLMLSDVATLPTRLRFASALIGTLCMVLLGFLLTHRVLALRLGDGGRNALLRAGAVVHRMRGMLGAFALLAAVFAMAPYLPNTGGGMRRYRRF